jgi:ubiquinone/menaquinone biosynthesis C-methylase UbiE
MIKFKKTTDSHQHSLETLNQLYQYDDFMYSIKTVVDLGCGKGDDLEWWATRTTRDETAEPLNIQCTGVDLSDRFSLTKKYSNIAYQQRDFESLIEAPKTGFDILWCHDSFQYAVNPLQTLSRWWNIASPGGMLYICVPVTQRIYGRQLEYALASGNFYHHTMVSLMYMLATNGWDCRGGFFKQSPGDEWIHACVYKSETEPMDPKNASWYKLSELKLLPESTDTSINAHGYLRQQDLIIRWLDHNIMSMAVK